MIHNLVKYLCSMVVTGRAEGDEVGVRERHGANRFGFTTLGQRSGRNLSKKVGLADSASGSASEAGLTLPE